MNKYLYNAIALLLLCTQQAFAQFPYTLTVLKEAYQPLSSGTAMTADIWDYQKNVAIPLGFTFHMDTDSTDHFFLWGGSTVGTDTTGIVPAFVLISTFLVDRGYINQQQSLSPLRYTVSGVPGSRIFKAEISDAGFQEEHDSWGALDDYMNIQVWLYEGSDIIELRYGPARVTHAYDYYRLGTNNMMPYIGYVPQLEYDAYDYPLAYILSGDPGQPYIDSLENTTGGNQGAGLDTIPDDGMVYRFVPLGYQDTGGHTIVGMPSMEQVRVFPTICDREISVMAPAAWYADYEVIALHGAITGIRGRLHAAVSSVDISHLPPGMYVLVLKNPEETRQYKFLKK